MVAVEPDRRMVAILSERLADLPNVHVVQADILEIDPAEAVAEATGRGGGPGVQGGGQPALHHLGGAAPARGSRRAP